jgi:ParB family chromosome partitioning protein
MPEMLLEIGLDELMADPSQPRKTFIDEEIARLAASVAARGVLQPLRVIRDEQRGCWVILTGESRFRAAKLAGLKIVPCIPVEGELSEIDKLADRLTENDVRNDLQPMEASRALARLKALKGCPAKTLVEEYGFSAAAITRAEALMSLPDTIQAMVGTGAGQLPASAAYEISRLDDPHAQAELASAVAGRRMTRDQAADAVRSRIGKKNVRPKASRLSCRLDGGVSVTVSAGEPLTWDTVLEAIDRIRKEAKKLCDNGKDVSALAQALRAS